MRKVPSPNLMQTFYLCRSGTEFLFDLESYAASYGAEADSVFPANCIENCFEDVTYFLSSQKVCAEIIKIP